MVFNLGEDRYVRPETMRVLKRNRVKRTKGGAVPLAASAEQTRAAAPTVALRDVVIDAYRDILKRLVETPGVLDVAMRTIAVFGKIVGGLDLTPEQGSYLRLELMKVAAFGCCE